MRYWILTLLCLAALIAYVQRSAISVPAAAIQRDLGFGPAALGWVMSAWYTSYAAWQLPSGWLTDRWGSRRALAVYALAWSLLTGATGLATDLGGLLVLWGLMGLAQAGIFPASAKAIGDWFPETRRAFASGLLACSMQIGAALAQYLTPHLLRVCTWQQTFTLLALPGLAWALIFFLLTPDSARQVHCRASEPMDWARLLGSLPMALLCLQQFLRAAAMVFFYTWFPTYLQETRALDKENLGYLAAWPPLGAMLGGLSGGAASDWLLARTGRRRLSRQGVAVAGMSGCALLTALAYFVNDAEEAMLLLSLGTFLGSFGGVSSYAVAIELGGRHVATVFSVMNMSGNVGAALFPLGVGWFVAHFQRWDLVLFSFAGCFAAAAVCWALLDPRGPLSEDTHASRRDTAESLSRRPGAG
jgi:MFS family permease